MCFSSSGKRCHISWCARRRHPATMDVDSPARRVCAASTTRAGRSVQRVRVGKGVCPRGFIWWVWGGSGHGAGVVSAFCLTAEQHRQSRRAGRGGGGGQDACSTPPACFSVHCALRQTPSHGIAPTHAARIGGGQAFLPETTGWSRTLDFAAPSPSLTPAARLGCCLVCVGACPNQQHVDAAVRQKDAVHQTDTARACLGAPGHVRRLGGKDH